MMMDQEDMNHIFLKSSLRDNDEKITKLKEEGTTLLQASEQFLQLNNTLMSEIQKIYKSIRILSEKLIKKEHTQILQKLSKPPKPPKPPRAFVKANPPIEQEKQKRAQYSMNKTKDHRHKYLNKLRNK